MVSYLFLATVRLIINHKITIQVLGSLMLKYCTYSSLSDSSYHGEPLLVAFWPPQLRLNDFLTATIYRFKLATLKYIFLTLSPIAGAVGGLRTQFRDAPELRKQGSSDAVWRSTAAETRPSSTGGYPTEARRAGDGSTRFGRAKRHVGSQMRPILSTVAAAAAATAVLQQQLIQQQLVHYCSSS